MDDPAIAAVPAGSGNGVATSLGFEMADVEGTAVSLIKNIQIDFDLLKCTFDEGATDADGTPVSEPVYSIASVYWGIVAQVDHRSERFRFLGGFRFTLEALISIFTFKPEQACILLHRASNNIVLSARSSEWYNIEYDEMFYTNILVANCPYVTYDMKFAPHAEVSSGTCDLVALEPVTPFELLFDIFLKLADGSHVGTKTAKKKGLIHKVEEA